MLNASQLIGPRSFGKLSEVSDLIVRYARIYFRVPTLYYLNGGRLYLRFFKRVLFSAPPCLHLHSLFSSIERGYQFKTTLKPIGLSSYLISSP